MLAFTGKSLSEALLFAEHGGEHTMEDYHSFSLLAKNLKNKVLKRDP